MRRLHLDELPQAINLLRGELSLVGPRPEQPRYVAELTEKIPFYEVRHLVNPGLTGWAQVKFHYGASVQDALEKLRSNSSISDTRVQCWTSASSPEHSTAMMRPRALRPQARSYYETLSLPRARP